MLHRHTFPPARAPVGGGREAAKTRAGSRPHTPLAGPRTDAVMAASAGGFIRTVLARDLLADSSLAFPSEERLKRSQLQLDDKNFRLRQQVTLSMSRSSRKASTDRVQRTFSAPNYVSPTARSLFDYPTIPLLGGYSKSTKLTSYTTKQGLMNGGARYSSGTSRFLSEGLQSQTIKPTRRIEISPDSSPVLLRSLLRMESGYAGRGLRGRDTTMVFSRRVSYGEANTGARLIGARPALRSSSRYARSELVATAPRPVLLSRAASHSAQRHAVARGREPITPDGVFVEVFPTSPAVKLHPGLSQSTSQLYERDQIGALHLQPAEESSSFHGMSRRKQAHVATNWKQTTYQTNYSTAGNAAVTQEIVPVECSIIEAQAQAQAQAQSSQQTSASQESIGKQTSRSNFTESIYGEVDVEWTMETAVAALSHDNIDYAVYGANFIQHECFHRPDAKKELYALDGIEKLIALLSNEDVEVQRAACGAIRNGVFEENDSKLEVKEHNGLQKLVQLLGQSSDIDTKKQITGLLWNLSSNEHLKADLIESALNPLTTSIIIPFAGWPDGDVKHLDVDPDIFYNTTGCMRNLSSASPEGRKQMRECEGLIDSLVHYIQFTIANNQEDDKSTENCMCILHNLSFQLENELPGDHSQNLAWKNSSSAHKKSAGCFGARSSRLKEQGAINIPCIEEKRNPRGVEWLWHSLVVRMYLSLVARSTRNYTQEASLGALQNLTASNGPMGHTISETITSKENGLQHIRRMLYSKEVAVQKAAVSLVRNMSRNTKVHDELATLIMPDLIAILPETNKDSPLPNEAVTYNCHVLNNLIQSNVQSARNFVQNGGLSKVVGISNSERTVPNSAAKAASNMLYSLWLHRELHGAYKKAGFTKTDFINNRTTKAYHAARERIVSI
uniref:plakophilin-2-like isoform X2 n=1 Tax=Pristiophorus japonicus TaxID=55135 RepID=UPI00398ED587